jgi:hypothetical protein
MEVAMDECVSGMEILSLLGHLPSSVDHHDSHAAISAENNAARP